MTLGMMLYMGGSGAGKWVTYTLSINSPSRPHERYQISMCTGGAAKTGAIRPKCQPGFSLEVKFIGNFDFLLCAQLYLLIFFLAALLVCGGSQARNGTHTTAVSMLVLLTPAPQRLSRFLFFFFFFFFCPFLPFLGLLPQHMEVPRLGVESEL